MYIYSDVISFLKSIREVNEERKKILERPVSD